MSHYLDPRYAPDSRPTTTTETDLDAYGTPMAASPFMTPVHLGSGVPGPMPSAYSLSSSSAPRDSGYNNYQNYGDRDAVGTPNNNSAPLLPHEGGSGENYNKEGAAFLGGGSARRRSFYKKPWFYFLLAAAAVIIALAVALPVVFVNKSKHPSSAAAKGGSGSGGGSSGGGSGSGTGSGGGGKGGSNLATWGGDGSTVTKADGSTFVYHNSFGGFCEYSDIIKCDRLLTTLVL